MKSLRCVKKKSIRLFLSKQNPKENPNNQKQQGNRMNQAIETFIAKVKFNQDGLVAAIAQEKKTGEVLMLAWQNEESLRLTLEKMEMVYFSRSRQKLWHKGESSGHTQIVHEISLDCDGDAILAKVTQNDGIACHTGRKSCFYQSFSATEGIKENAPVLKDPKRIYSQ